MPMAIAPDAPSDGAAAAAAAAATTTTTATARTTSTTTETAVAGPSLTAAASSHSSSSSAPPPLRWRVEVQSIFLPSFRYPQSDDEQKTPLPIALPPIPRFTAPSTALPSTLSSLQAHHSTARLYVHSIARSLTSFVVSVLDENAEKSDALAILPDLAARLRGATMALLETWIVNLVDDQDLVVE
ncbi:hypothetical protein HDU67_004883, partial [Dinochytrium kinnereticum]